MSSFESQEKKSNHGLVRSKCILARQGGLVMTNRKNSRRQEVTYKLDDKTEGVGGFVTWRPIQARAAR